MATATSSTPIEDKWGSALDAGFLVIPNVLLLRQHELDLTDGEMLVLLNILMAWHEKERLPFPRPETIAKRMGISPRTARRHITGLVEKGWLGRVSKTDSPLQYDPATLVSRLKLMGKELGLLREQRLRESTEPIEGGS